VLHHWFSCSTDFSDLESLKLLNRTVCSRHHCMKITVLSCHRCLIKTGVEGETTFKYRLEFWPPGASK
jgi:hypothetical protein